MPEPKSSAEDSATQSEHADAGQPGAEVEKGDAVDQSADVLETFDMHCDTIDVLGMAAFKPFADFGTKHSGGLVSNDADVSQDRMGDARWVQCYAIWIPPTEGKNSTDVDPLTWYRTAAGWFKQQMRDSGDKIVQVRDFTQVQSILDEGKVPAILTVENASCLENDVELVDEFARDGVLVASLTWDTANALGSGISNPGVGLTDLGRDCVAALEEHDIVLDVSHLNDTCFWNVDTLATKPYIATHSNSRAVCDSMRNLTDDQFRAIANRGGVVGLSLHNGLVRNDGSEYSFDDLALHVEHWLDLGGEDAIALGSDRDGSNIPGWVADCSTQASLYDLFAGRLGTALVHKLFFQNAMRFFGAS